MRAASRRIYQGLPSIATDVSREMTPSGRAFLGTKRVADGPSATGGFPSVRTPELTTNNASEHERKMGG